METIIVYLDNAAYAPQQVAGKEASPSAPPAADHRHCVTANQALIRAKMPGPWPD